MKPVRRNFRQRAKTGLEYYFRHRICRSPLKYESTSSEEDNKQEIVAKSVRSETSVLENQPKQVTPNGVITKSVTTKIYDTLITTTSCTPIELCKSRDSVIKSNCSISTSINPLTSNSTISLLEPTNSSKSGSSFNLTANKRLKGVRKYNFNQ